MGNNNTNMLLTKAHF